MRYPLLSTLLSAAFTLNVYAQSSNNLETVSQVEQPRNSFRAATCHDNTVYLSDYYGLIAVDYSDPVDPTTTQSSFFLGAMWGVSADNSLLAVNNYIQGIGIYDISNPAIPQQISLIPSAADYDCVLRDTLLIAYHQNLQEIRFYSLSDPAHPKLIGSIPQDICAFDLKLFSDTLLICSGESCRLLDISEPNNVVEIGRLEVAETSEGFYEAGTLADGILFTVGWQGLRTYDISTAPVIVPLSASPLPGIDQYSRDIVVRNGLAYVADGWRGVRIFDVSNPAHPVELCLYPMDGFASSIELMDHYALIPTIETGLITLDITNPASPVEVSRYPEGTKIGSVFLEDHSMFVQKVIQTGSTIPVEFHPVLEGYILNRDTGPVLNFELPLPKAISGMVVTSSGGIALNSWRGDWNIRDGSLFVINETGNEPEIGKEVDLGFALESWQLVNSHLYLLADANECFYDQAALRFFDVDLSNPLDPSLVRTIIPPEGVTGPFAIINNRLSVQYVPSLVDGESEDSIGIFMYDLDGFSSEAVPLAQKNQPGRLLNLVSHGNGLFVENQVRDPNDQSLKCEIHFCEYDGLALVNDRAILTDLDPFATFIVKGNLLALAEPTYEAAPNRVTLYNVEDPYAPLAIAAYSTKFPLNSYDINSQGFLSVHESVLWTLLELNDELIPNTIDDRVQGIPDRFELTNIYPNPFNSSLALKITLHSSAKLNVRIFNIHGQLVATLADGVFEPGIQHFSWNPRGMATGVYLVRANVNGVTQVRKAVYIK